MEIRRKPADRRLHPISSTAKYFRKCLYGLLGLVLSGYLVLFIVVVSRHIDHAAQVDIERTIAAAESAKEKGAPVVLRPVVAGIGPSLLGMDRFQERWAAMGRSLNTNNEGRPVVRTRRRVHVCMQPKFREPPGPLIALASFPGSGNTWVRFLVQQATGILTGSVYRDYSLKRNGFPAESVANGSVLTIKTHEWGESTRLKFEKAVLLIRDPYGALVAEFNRRAGGHVGHAAPEKFHKGNAWSSFVQTHSRLWMESVLDWLQFRGPLLVLRYESMKEELPGQLIRLLKFLDTNVSWSTFQCVLRNRDGIFRRAKKQLNFDLFDEHLKKTVDSYKEVVETALRYHEQGIKFDINNTTLSQDGNGDSVNMSVLPMTFVDKDQNTNS